MGVNVGASFQDDDTDDNDFDRDESDDNYLHSVRGRLVGRDRFSAHVYLHIRTCTYLGEELSKS